ncbi:hypothetical protein [Singulisphaera sp. PoT]|uniref:hypothetical protein n=1 Tax=Singulisphaera sp. PoT TaxID=3411797 RepID=UPI003BF55592
MSRALPPIERALRSIQHRAAEDRILKHLASVPIHPIDFVDPVGMPKGYRRAIEAPTDDRIEIPTKGDAVSITRPGRVSVLINVTREGVDGDVSSGLYKGGVTWRTDNPRVFVWMSWCSKDPGLPDRLLAIVREELGREGLRLLPMRKLDWPPATTSERLAQLLPPDCLLPVTRPPKVEVVLPRDAEKAFASPYDVVAANNLAVAKQDWRAWARCLTPASQGAVIRELLFVAVSGGRKCPELIGVIENHLKFKLIDASDFPGQFVRTKEAKEFLETLGNPPVDDAETAAAWMTEVFRKRVGDIPAFLDDCFQQLQGAPEGYGRLLGSEDIRIEGDKASGYWIDRRPVPDAKEAEKRDVASYLPRYFPVHFRRIGGSWLIAHNLGHAR